MTDHGRTRIETSIDNLMRRERISRRAFMRRAGRGGIALGARAQEELEEARRTRWGRVALWIGAISLAVLAFTQLSL